MMRQLNIPNAMMKLMPTGDGFDLMLLHPVDRQLITVAHILPHANGEAEAWGKVLCSAFLAYHAIEGLLEYCQPDGWDMFEEEGKPWKMALRANCIAHGEPIPQIYAEDEPGLTP